MLPMSREPSMASPTRSGKHLKPPPRSILECRSFLEALENTANIHALNQIWCSGRSRSSHRLTQTL